MILKALGLVTILVFVVFMVGAANILAQTEEWKTYLNPDFKFTLQYPGYFFGEESGISETDNTTEFNLKGDNIEIYLSIIPLNSTASNTDAAFSYIRNTYDRLTESDGISSIQNISEVKYGGQQAYKTILDAGGGAIYGYATIQHGDMVLFFYMFNNDRANYQGTMFDQIVNSTRFFD